ncbi:Zinc finger X-linked protein ZXDB [Fasciolopsis buskii]|uniref:Zinc finger X-linked protein ZXDB n=1 Tax=Fasciolopsis buskii TaxID=27845 RepID=A0A8E0VEW4_9TREM|nr:Zinc finger X-linked protein ZXDB [Fasciolopsis buski]
MLHRPTLIPNTMKTPGKPSRNCPKMESIPCSLITNDEIMVVEPTDPDEDRMREQQEQQLQQQQQDGFRKRQQQKQQQQQSRQQRPASVHEFDVQSECTSETCWTSTDSPKPNSGNTPLTEALLSLLSIAARSFLSTLNGPTSPNFTNKFIPSQNGVKSCMVPGGVSEILFQTSNFAGGSSSAPSDTQNTQPATGSHCTAASTTDSLHPLVAALLVNCATVNLITQHVRSLGIPLYISPLLGQNTTFSDLNLSSLLSSSLLKSFRESNTAQQQQQQQQQQPDSTHPTVPFFVSPETGRTNQTVVAKRGVVLSPNKSTTGTINMSNPSEDYRTTSIVQSLLNEAKSAIEFSKTIFSPTSKTPNRVKRFQCPMPNCHMAFYSRFNQTEHIRTHTGERPFICSFSDCTAAFKRRRDLRDHISVHKDCPINAVDESQMVDSEPPTMPITSKSAPLIDFSVRGSAASKIDEEDIEEMDDLEAGVEVCAPTPDHPDACSEDLRGSVSMNQNSELEQEFVPPNHNSVEQKTSTDSPKPHISGRRHSCPYQNCDKAYAKLNKLKEHLRSHTGERPYVCREPGCGAAFIRLYGVRRHELIHIFGRKGAVRTATDVNRTNKSAKVQPSSDDPAYDISRQQPYSHSPSNISITTPVSSSSMAKLLMTNTETPHTRLDNEDPSINIDIGPDSSNSTTTVTTASKRAFPIIAPKGEVKQPLRSLSPISGSPGVRRPHICPFKDCGKAFPKLNKLREHICRHTGERPFVCVTCNASFVRMYDLRRHSKIHLRAAISRQNSLRTLGPKHDAVETDSASLSLKPEPDSTLLC